jgi:hypothetical protein
MVRPDRFPQFCGAADFFPVRVNAVFRIARHIGRLKNKSHCSASFRFLPGSF